MRAPYAAALQSQPDSLISHHTIDRDYEHKILCAEMSASLVQASKCRNVHLPIMLKEVLP